MKTIILVGGEGTRLKSVVKDVPKPMADINGKPFLSYLMDNMIKYGATEFILCVGHKKEIIMDFYKDNYKNIPVKYSIEEDLLGTGGAIKQAFDIYNIENAISINGDTFVKMDYLDFYKKMQNEKFGIALKYVPDASRYGLVKTLDDRIIEFTEKQDKIKDGFISAGIYFINKSMFDRDLPNKFSFEKDILEKDAKILRPKYYKAEDYFIDIGIPESYDQACKELEGEIYAEK